MITTKSSIEHSLSNEERLSKIKKDIRRSFTMPALTLCLTAGILGFTMFHTIPKVEATYQEMGINPSYPTKVLFRVSHLFDR